MNTLCQTRVILWVPRAGDDAFVRLTLPMKAFEISIVVGHHGSPVGRSVNENLGVVDALASAPCILDRQHVVTQAAQLMDNRQRKILIRVESGHAWSVGLVVADVRVDLGRMLGNVVPGRMQVFWS